MKDQQEDLLLDGRLSRVSEEDSLQGSIKKLAD